MLRPSPIPFLRLADALQSVTWAVTWRGRPLLLYAGACKLRLWRGRISFAVGSPAFLPPASLLWILRSNCGLSALSARICTTPAARGIAAQPYAPPAS